MIKNLNEPIRVEVTRGGCVESFHEVSAVLSRPDGTVEKSWGNQGQTIFPRSAVKPIQALAVVSSGALADLELTLEETALACASHGGEPKHVKGVEGWLYRLGFSISDLECGTHWPSHDESSRQLACSQSSPEAIHNKCSGKHSGFLTLALQLGVDHRGYVRPDHPVQLRVRRVLESVCGLDLTDAPCGTDGCSVPTWGIPLKDLSRGMARWGTGRELSDKLASAAEWIRKSMMLHPHLVAGTGRYCSKVLEYLKGKVLAKTGAEGVYCAAYPELGLGLALKCRDGHTRAAEAVTGAVTDRLGLLDDRGRELLRTESLRNLNGIETGVIRVVFPDS